MDRCKRNKQYSAEAEENLLEKTKQAAEAGAKMVLWQEAQVGWPSRKNNNLFPKRCQLLQRKKFIC